MPGPRENWSGLPGSNRCSHLGRVEPNHSAKPAVMLPAGRVYTQAYRKYNINPYLSPVAGREQRSMMRLTSSSVSSLGGVIVAPPPAGAM